MSTFIHVDSRFRNRLEFPNPARFHIPVEATKDWYIERTVNPVRANNKNQVINMVYHVKLLTLTIPYDRNIFLNEPYLYIQLQSTRYKDPKLIGTMNTSSEINLSEATFKVDIDKLQGPPTGYGTTPPTDITVTLPSALPNTTVFYSIGGGADNNFYYSDGLTWTLVPDPSPPVISWIHYKSNMNQVMRLELKGAYFFRVFNGNNQTIFSNVFDTLYPEPLNPNRQVNALFEVTPYVRSDYFDKIDSYLGPLFSDIA